MRILKQGILVVSLGAVLAASGAFAADEGYGMSSANPSAGSQNAPVMTEVKVRDLNRHPENFTGQQVMVTGKVDRIEKPGTFVLNGSGILNHKILVVVANEQAAGTAANQQAGAAAPVIREGEKIQLTGKVEELGLTTIEERYGPMKAEVKAEFEGTMPILVVPPSGVKSLS